MDKAEFSPTCHGHVQQNRGKAYQAMGETVARQRIGFCSQQCRGKARPISDRGVSTKCSLRSQSVHHAGANFPNPQVPKRYQASARDRLPGHRWLPG